MYSLDVWFIHVVYFNVFIVLCMHWLSFRIYVHVSSLEVLIQNVGLHQAMQNESGLTNCANSPLGEPQILTPLHIGYSQWCPPRQGAQCSIFRPRWFGWWVVDGMCYCLLKKTFVDRSVTPLFTRFLHLRWCRIAAIHRTWEGCGSTMWYFDAFWVSYDQYNIHLQSRHPDIPTCCPWIQIRGPQKAWRKMIT